MVNSKKNKVYIINVNSIVYAIIFLLILISTIYFISKGIGDANVTIYSSGLYQQDQVMAIEAVANNVIVRINNTIAVSAIFFAIIVSSISIFQFIKVKDFDKEINKLLKESEILKEELSSSLCKMDNLKEQINEIDAEKDKLELYNIKTQLEFNIYKISNEFYKPGSWLNQNIKLIDETISLAENHPKLIDEIEIAKLYYKKAYALNDLGVKDIAVSLANRALDKFEEKYPNMEVVNIRDMSYIEEIAIFLIDIHLEDNDEKSVEKVLDRIEKVIDFQLDERMAFLYSKKVEEAIKVIKENKKYYGEYFIEKFKKYYYDGYFEEFKNDKRFINIIKEFGME